MSNSSFDSIDAFKKNVSESSLEQFKEYLSHYSLSDCAESFVCLSKRPAIESKNKLESLFQFVDSPSTLEHLARHFSLSHFLSFLDFLKRYPSYQNRCSFILVGLQPEIFFQALHVFESDHLDLLKNESLLEPLQYHLIQFVHKGESLHQQLDEKIQQFKQNLHLAKTEELAPDMLQGFIDCLDSCKNNLLSYLECASTALSIVWNTDRTDLIEKVSSINEALQSQLMRTIGHPSFDGLSSTGLYSFLEKTFSDIFDESLKDDDDALEGLTRLSIWYLKDYWELGLLPTIQHCEDLDLNPQQYNEEERRAYQHSLFSIVHQQLKRLGIETVGDLKKAHLFSKPLLEIYIEQHKHLLTHLTQKERHLD